MPSSIFTLISPSLVSMSETKQSNSLSRIPKTRSLASGTFWEKSLLEIFWICQWPLTFCIQIFGAAPGSAHGFRDGHSTP